MCVKRNPVSNINVSVERVILKETLVLMCLVGVCLWQFRDLKCDCCTSRLLLCEKNNKLFLMCGA